MTREVEKHRRKLYGRRKGPKLSAHQEQLLKTLLPQFALDLESDRDPRTYFPGPVDDVWLEIGFGAGEHLLWQIDHHPHVGLIGAEPYVSGTAKLLSKLRTPTVALHAPPPPQTLEEKIDHAPLSSSTRGGGAGEVGRGEIAKHIRLYSGDARDIIEALPTATLGRVFILFPDPWPKTRHHKRRFIQTDTLGALARTMTIEECRFTPAPARPPLARRAGSRRA